MEPCRYSAFPKVPLQVPPEGAAHRASIRSQRRVEHIQSVDHNEELQRVAGEGDRNDLIEHRDQGVEITSSVVAADVRRMMVDSTEGGRFAGNRCLWRWSPPSGRQRVVRRLVDDDILPRDGERAGARVAGFSATLNETEPGPACVVALVRVINDPLVVTVHEHPLPVATVNVALAPAPDI